MGFVAEKTSASVAWQAWFDAQRSRFDRALDQHLAELRRRPGLHERLLEAAAYSLRLPGKRLRPILTLECCRACGGSEADALPAALAIECVHTFSLVHDDLPAMDDDDLRRGHPTNHKVFGEALAILAGDWLLAHAFELIAEVGGGRAAAELARSLSAGTQAMIIGQAADIESEGSPASAERVDFIHRNKTAALLESACRLGGLAAEADELTLERLARFGANLGLAFQIVDDLLDHAGDARLLGKAAQKDAGVEKQTFPSVYGVDESRARAGQYVDAAVALLGPLGDRADQLVQLARFVMVRNH